jgi:protein-tyrosine-phosphatase
MNILFICEGNINRSQMAATILKHKRPEIGVFSAGTVVSDERAGKTVSMISEKGSNAMAEIGFDMTQNIVNRITPEIVSQADRIILMGNLGDTLPAYVKESGIPMEEWTIPDPGKKEAPHADVRDAVVKEVDDLIQRLGL